MVCMCLFTFRIMLTYVHMYVRMYVRMDGCMYVCMHVCMYVCVIIDTYIYLEQLWYTWVCINIRAVVDDPSISMQQIPTV